MRTGVMKRGIQIMNFIHQFLQSRNIRESLYGSFNNNLYLFSSDNLFSNNWASHPLNPIISDVRKSRPAGKIFKHNGYLYRPSQDCSKDYGYRTIINKIIKINDKEYQECTVDSIEPNWMRNLKGTHTFNFSENYTVIDAKVREIKFGFR